MTIAIQPPAPLFRTSPLGGPSPPDSWLDALAKLVPGEIVIAFTAALQVPQLGDRFVPHLTVLIVFAALVPVALWRSAKRATTSAPVLQYVVRTTTFVLYGLGVDPTLMKSLGRLAWVPGVGAIAIAALAALVLVPPGAANPPPARA
jgi:hypothetical protein